MNTDIITPEEAPAQAATPTTTTTTKTEAAPAGKPPPRRDRQPRQGQGRASRNADEVIARLPVDWSATVLELDEEGTKNSRTRLRLMVFENPDKGFKVLPFMTVRHAKRMTTDRNTVEVLDDMDLLPYNVLENALPVALFDQGAVLENFLEILAEYAKKQAALPPPSKRPLTHRPFAGSLAKVVRKAKQEKHHEQHAQPMPPAPKRQSKKQRKRNRKGRTDRTAVLLMPLL